MNKPKRYLKKVNDHAYQNRRNFLSAPRTRTDFLKTAARGAASLTLALAVTVAYAQENADQEQAQRILQKTGVTGGLVVHVGCGQDPTLTLALRASDAFIIQGLETDAENVSKVRKTVQDAGAYGPVSVAAWSGGALPYVDNLVNLMVVSGEEIQVSRDEILRVLRPGGTAVFLHPKSPIANAQWHKPWPASIDHWTHFLHGPDNNAVAHDTVVGAPRQVQWRGGLDWGRDHMAAPSLTSLVSDGGRLFAIMDYGPTTSIALPSNWQLVARDAFNGVELWRKPLGQKWITGPFRGVPPIFARRLVAVAGNVYVTLAVGEPVTELDGATGQILRTFAGTEQAAEILVADDRLVVAMAGGAKGGIRSIELQTGAMQWQAPVDLAPLSLAAGEGKVLAIDRESNELCAWESNTGRSLWKCALVTQQNLKAFRFGAVVVLKDGVVLVGMDADPKGYKIHGYQTAVKAGSLRKLLAFDAGSGQPLWEAPFGRGFMTSADIFVIDGVVWHTTEEQIQDWENPGMTFNKGRDLKTGKVVATLDTPKAFLLNLGVPHARCYRHKASVNYIFAGRDGVETMHLKSGEIEVTRWVRGTCQYGVMPANGLLYAPPHACSCYIATILHGFYAFSSAPVAPPEPLAGRLVKGSAYATTATAKETSSAWWPTYRHDAARSGHYRGAVEPHIRPAWSATLGGELTPPICAAGKLFVVRKDTHQIIALDAETGGELWRFTAGGMVDSPPTYHAGGILFGCRDGRMWRVRASDGALAWTFLAAPGVRQICRNGQLESAWPIHGSVLIADGKAHAVAGISSFIAGGLDYYQLDAVTGELVQHHVILDQDPLQPLGKSRWDLEGSLNDILAGDGEGWFLRQREFTWQGEPKKTSRPHLFSPAGFLDSSMHHRYFWVYTARYPSGVGAARVAAKERSGRIMCQGDQHLYGFRTEVFSFGRSSKSKAEKRKLYGDPINSRHGNGQWAVPLPFSPNAMVLTENALFVAGPNGNIEESLESFSGALGKSLWAVDVHTGATLCEWPLDVMPVFDGLIAGGGRLYLSAMDGTVRCYSGEKKRTGETE